MHAPQTDTTTDHPAGAAGGGSGGSTRLGLEGPPSRSPESVARVGVAIGAATFLLWASALSGQEAPSTLRDSATAVAAARSAQLRFERDRVNHLPQDRSGFSGSSCDERVGRMCLWLEGRSDWWWPEREPPPLVAARDRLIEELARAAADAPGDPWVLGQRVVYLGEAGRWREAREVARRCGVAVAGWCDALRGMALHMLGEYAAAEAAFSGALDAMDPSESARWREVRDLLDGAGREAESRARERHDSWAESRFWALSDPLFLVPGSDRYTEHMARRTWNRTREEARNAYGMSWGDDLDELVVRYGWEVGWERSDPLSTTIGARPTGVGHQDPRSQGFVAPAAVWDGAAESTRPAWNPGSRLAPRTGYAPAYAPTFLDLDTELAVLPRGDSAVLVVALPGMPDDTSFHAAHDHPPPPPARDFGSGEQRGLFAVSLEPPAGESARSGMVLDSLFARRAVTAPGLAGALRLTVPAGPHIVSVEVWDAEQRRAARLRRGVSVPKRPPDLLTLSDLLPARAEGPAIDSLDALLPDLLAAVRYAPGDTIRVGWEVYGLGWTANEPLDYTLSLREESGGFFRGLGRTLGIVGDARRIHLEWSEVGPAAPGPRFRVVDLVVPPDFEEGDYRLTLELRTAGRNTAVSEREVRVGR